MIIRNAVLMNLRAWRRSLLFFGLIFLLTMMLCTGTGIAVRTSEMLEQTEENYRSVLVLEYMGGRYPDADAADRYARAAFEQLDPDALRSLPGVREWLPYAQANAVLEGYHRVYGTIPYPSEGVIIAESFLAPTERTAYVPAEFDPEAYEVYVVSDLYDGDLVVHEYGREYEIPCYQYDPYEDVLYRFTDYEDGVVPGGREGLIPPYYIQNMEDGTFEYVYEGSTDLHDPELKFFYYQPVDGQYYELTTRIVSYAALLSKSVYTRDERENYLITLDTGGTGFVAEKGKKYIIHGAYIDNNSGNKTFSITPFENDPLIAPYAEISGTDDPLVTSGIFAEYAKLYRQGNDYAVLSFAPLIEDLEPFQQGALQLAEGRFPQKGEAGVCLIDGESAASMNLKTGDSVTVSAGTSREDNRYIFAGLADPVRLTVCGITTNVSDYSGHIWTSVPLASDKTQLFGYYLGSLGVDNQKGPQIAEQVRALVPDGVRVTLYDQGYQTATEPLESLRSAAVTVVTGSAIAAFCVLVLFAYLFIGRQSETLQILTGFGVKAPQIRTWFMAGAMLVAAPAVLLGALVPAAGMGFAMRLFFDSASGLYAADERYSETMIGMRKAIDAFPSSGVLQALAAGAVVLVTALVLCLVFLALLKREKKSDRGKQKIRVPKDGTSVKGRGASRFALLSLKRGGTKAAIVPLVCFILSLLMAYLGALTGGWKKQLDDLYANSEISGSVVSLDGRMSSNLVIEPGTVRTLYRTGCLKEVSVSFGFHFWDPADMPAFGSGSFAQEHRQTWIESQPLLMAVNSLKASPEFFFGVPSVQWAEGYDESLFMQTGWSLREDLINSRTGLPQKEYPVVVSRAYAERYGLNPGDRHALHFQDVKLSRRPAELILSVRIAGIYTSSSAGENIYTPLSFVYEPMALTDPKYEETIDPMDPVERFMTFQTCSFTLQSATRLEEFRDKLYEAGFSEPDSLRPIRNAVLIRDAVFTRTAGGLKRYIGFAGVLLPVVAVLLGLTGFVISWLLINGRRMEFAMMAGFGSPKKRIFGSFFIEQALLCAAGCIPALVLAFILPDLGIFSALCILVFIVCYLAGTAVSVRLLNRSHLMDLLSERQ